MACFHPLPAVQSKDTKIAKDGHVYHPLIIAEHDDEVLPLFRRRVRPWVDYKTGEVFETFKIPCGVCAGCRMDKSRQWADRCSLEYLMYPPDTCWFLTLTLNEYYIENYRVWEKPDGSWQDNELYTLDDSLLTDFKKRLLSGFDYEKLHKGVRFFACGEYGGEHHRPHFHVILFNAPLNDIEYWSTHQVGPYRVPIYRSKFVEKYWGFGYVWIERYDWNNAAYVARYTQKKSGIPSKAADQILIDQGLQPEFLRMSRKPGVAVPYFHKNKDKFYKGVYRDVVDSDGNVLYQELSPLSVILPAHGSKPSSTLKIPRLFDLKFEQELRDDLTELHYAIDEGCSDALDIKYELEERILCYNKYHELRKLEAEAIENDLLSKTDLDKYEYQDMVASASQAAYSMLKRNNFDKMS